MLRTTTTTNTSLLAPSLHPPSAPMTTRPTTQPVSPTRAAGHTRCHSHNNRAQPVSRPWASFPPPLRACLGTHQRLPTQVVWRSQPPLPGQDGRDQGRKRYITATYCGSGYVGLLEQHMSSGCRGPRRTLILSGCAKLQRSTLPYSSALCILSIAAAASSLRRSCVSVPFLLIYIRVLRPSHFSMKVTKPNPRFFWVSWSSGMFTSFTSPNGRNAAWRTASFTFSSRPPAVRELSAENIFWQAGGTREQKSLANKHLPISKADVSRRRRTDVKGCLRVDLHSIHCVSLCI